MSPERDGIDQREHRHSLIACRDFSREDIRHRHHLVLLLEDLQRVATDDKVVALRIVVGGVEGYGIELLLGKIPGIRRDRALVVTTTEQKRAEDGEEATAHRHSFDSFCNRTQEGNDVRRLKRERGVPAIMGADRHV